MLRSTVGAVLLAAGLSTAIVCPATAAAARGYRIEQRSGESVSVTTISAAGARYELLQPPRRGGRAIGGKRTILVATIIRYADAHEVLLNPAQYRFQEVPLRRSREPSAAPNAYS